MRRENNKEYYKQEQENGGIKHIVINSFLLKRGRYGDKKLVEIEPKTRYIYLFYGSKHRQYKDMFITREIYSDYTLDFMNFVILKTNIIFVAKEEIQYLPIVYY